MDLDFPVVTVAYTLAIYNFVLAAGATMAVESPWATTLGFAAGAFWALGALAQYRSSRE